MTPTILNQPGPRPPLFDTVRIDAAAEAIAQFARQLALDTNIIDVAWQQIAAETAARLAECNCQDHPIAEVTGTIAQAAKTLAIVYGELQRQAAAQRMPAWLPAGIRSTVAAMLPARLLPALNLE